MKAIALVVAGIMIMACTFFAGVPAALAAAAFDGTIAAVGDSLTAGYGLRHSEAYPALLEKKLHQSGYNWRVVNAGISGETTSGTVSRLDWILRLKPDIVVLETGANDGLRGIDPKLVQKNLEKLVSTLQSKGIVVVLAGMKMVANLGHSYTTEFAGIYDKVAKRHNLIMVPFFLQNVAGHSNLNLSDGIHPNANGYRIVTDNVYPYVIKAIQTKQGKK